MSGIDWDAVHRIQREIDEAVLTPSGTHEGVFGTGFGLGTGPSEGVPKMTDRVRLDMEAMSKDLDWYAKYAGEPGGSLIHALALQENINRELLKKIEALEKHSHRHSSGIDASGKGPGPP